ncbi:MAG: hypothetical protein H6737_17480 [Alphaproteobacteria bacterium]|nr:hypothetical protein [Alphaproteobacteria bacterium]
MPSESDGAEHGIYQSRTLWFFFALTVAICTGLTAYFAPESWGWFRIGAGGLVSGALCYLMVFVNHMIIFPALGDDSGHEA